MSSFGMITRMEAFVCATQSSFKLPRK